MSCRYLYEEEQHSSNQIAGESGCKQAIAELPSGLKGQQCE